LVARLKMQTFIVAFVLLCSFVLTARAAIYLPGVAHSYKTDENVDLMVSKITSVKTQVPYDYYALPYCKPKHLQVVAENVGEVLEGDRIEESVYHLDMRNPQSCTLACSKKLSNKDRKKFITAIEDDYYVHWLVDNLPVGIRTAQKEPTTESGFNFVRGFPVGFASSKTSVNNKVEKNYYLYNHIRIIISFYEEPSISENDFLSLVDTQSEENAETAKIVGFRVEPMSIKHKWSGSLDGAANPSFSTCNSLSPPRNDPGLYLALDSLGNNEEIAYTYDVLWEKSETPWARRWDVYLDADSPSDKIHWFSISNSILIVLMLAVMIALILVRLLNKDITQYNDKLNAEEAKEESGWKLVHGDVFRPPSEKPMLLSVLVGSGAQLLGMTFATLSFAVFGLLSPSNRGGLVTALIILFVLMGSLAGYYSAIIYKMFRGTEWKTATLLTALMFPGVSSCIFSAINVVLYAEGSSGALPLKTFFTLIFLWFCVSLPLVFLGSFFGYKKETLSHPVRTNQIPRAVPSGRWFLKPELTIALAGILPFGAVTVELYFIMSALWLHHMYYIFGFLFLVLIVLIITTAEVSILLCYYQLSNEDHHWWWRSFLTGGSCSVYIMLYAVWYNITVLELHGLVPELVYYGYMALLSWTTFIVTGTIGFFSCYMFNIYIYSSLKVD